MGKWPDVVVVGCCLCCCCRQVASVVATGSKTGGWHPNGKGSLVATEMIADEFRLQMMWWGIQSGRVPVCRSVCCCC